MVVREGKQALGSALSPWELSGFSQSTFSWLFCTHGLTHECVLTLLPLGEHERSRKRPLLTLMLGKKGKKYLHLPLVILQLSGPSWSTTTCLLIVLPCHVYQNSFLNHSHRANKGPGAYGGTEMLNSMLIYLWLLQPTVTTSNNWIVLSIARLICYLIIKPGPLLIMASLETRRSGEKCIQGAMLMLKTHMALGAEQDLCQMQMLYWWLIKHALCGLLCL